MSIKVFSLSHATPVKSHSQLSVSCRYGGSVSLNPNLRLPRWEATYGASSTTSERVISQDALVYDGDLIFSATWGYGFKIFRLEDDGTLTLLYTDANPLPGQTYYVSIAIHKPSKQVFLGCYGTAGLAVYDYSTDPTAPVKTVLTEAGVIPFDEFGYQYTSGLVVAGDYLWMFPEDKNYTNAVRMHCVTQVVEEFVPSSSTKQFRRCGSYYHEAADRVYAVPGHDYDSDAYVIVGASTASPVVHPLNMGGLGKGWRGRGSGMIFNDANPNEIMFSYDREMIHIDISGIVNETGPAVDIGSSAGSLHNYPYYLDGYYRVCRNPENPNMILVPADRGHALNYGYYDQENKMFCFADRSDYGGLSASPEQMRSDYATRPIVTASSNGTEYIIGGHQGWQEGLFTYPKGQGYFEFYPTAEIVYGPFQLDNTGVVRNVRIDGIVEGLSYFKPSNTNMEIFVSNDDGATWESYNILNPGVHTFASSGNKVLVKFFFTNHPERCAYIYGQASGGISVMIAGGAYAPNQPKRRAIRRINRSG